MDKYKITESELVSGVVAAPDTLTDTPRNNKMVFDRLPRLIAGKVNGFIDAVISKFTDYYNKTEVDGKETVLNEAISKKANTADVYEKSETYSKSEADQMVEEKVIAAGAGDMTKAVYDRDGDGTVDTAENALALGGKAANLYALKTEVEDSTASADEAMAAAQAAQAKADAAMPASGGRFTGAVHHEASTYMKNGVFYNAYDTNGTSCCIIGISTNNDLMVGTASYPHPGDTILHSPNGRAVMKSGATNAFILVENSKTSDANYKVLRFGTLGYDTSWLRCEQDNGGYLGASSFKWKSVYATNGTIQTSDRNYKKNIQELDDKYIQLFDLIKPVTYQLISGDRTHTGFIAQDVEAAMKTVGLTAADLGFFCKDIKVVSNGEGNDVPVYDENGNPVYIYSLRYEEYIAIITEKVRRLEAGYNERIGQLEAKLAELEKKI